jgi:phenylalanyl-tRNA synthetase alpha chain
MKNINEILSSALKDIKKAKIPEEIEKLRIHYLGRKGGIISNLSKEIPSIPTDKRAGIGTKIKEAREKVEQALNDFNKQASTLRQPSQIDVTAPGKRKNTGTLHPVTKIFQEVEEIFHYMGFTWVDGPEAENDLYNFEKLNLHRDHPARDTQQTYYISDDLLLRTHTSNMQVRYMEKHAPPIRILSPGRVFRREMPDATHFPSFHQIEGLLVSENTNMTQLLGTLDFFAKSFFGPNIKTRVYGHHFPYTEPSIELEVFHSKKGWLEILGAGMVHPNVLRNGRIDPEKYRGWAFGMGADRLAMLKYEIEDIRLLFTNDLRFLNQF